MPFTPFHMGPGLAVKALGGRHFSVLSFGLAQVAMDIEPLVGMLRNADVLHGRTHSYLGATLIGLLVVLLAPAPCRLILGRWNRELRFYKLARLVESETLGRGPAATGAFLGTYSHVALDSIMHLDIRPLWPWSSANALQGAISIEALHVWCVASGLFGILVWCLWGYFRTRNG